MPGRSLQPPSRDNFIADAGWALRALREDPRLPLLTLAIAAVSVTPSLLTTINPILGSLGILALPVSFFAIGFYGTQRLWYLRLIRGGRPSGQDVWSVTWWYLGRYLVLALLAAIPVLPFAIAFFITSFVAPFTSYHIGETQQELRSHLHLWPASLILLIPILVLDFALTFVTPALAFTAKSTQRALRIGLRMVRSTWPAGALYVFFPPLALQLLSSVPSLVTGSSSVLLAASTVVAIMVNLVAKGATTAFYVRRTAVPITGSLWQENPDPGAEVAEPLVPGTS